MLTDMHMHSNFSPDASDSVDDMCRRAEELDLITYAITDHCDCNFWLPADEYEQISGVHITKDREMYGSRDYSQASIQAVISAKEKYSSLICGIELGQPLQNPDAAEHISKLKGLDFTLASLHMVKGKDDFYWLKYDSMSTDEIYALLDRYFSEMLEMCECAKFDVLAHMTYPLRYITGKYGITIDMDRYYEIIRKILLTLAVNGCGIEINTSGLRQEYHKTFPEKQYIKLFREIGGEILTIGSDAHCVSDVAKGVADGIELAKECGFKHAVFFKEHRPRFFPLI